MAEPNPYAAPVATSDASASVAEKARRVNLINRRSVALLLESLAYHLTLGVPLSLGLQLVVGIGPASLIAYAPLYVLRDLLAPVGFGKRFAGLRLESATAGPAPTVGARLLRGAILAVPAALLVEYFVAFYGNRDMQRLGDRLANTRVVDVDPERHGRSSWSWQLLSVMVLSALVTIMITPRLSAFWAGTLGIRVAVPTGVR